MYCCHFIFTIFMFVRSISDLSVLCKRKSPTHTANSNASTITSEQFRPLFICHWVQQIEGNKSAMPSLLEAIEGKYGLGGSCDPQEVSVSVMHQFLLPFTRYTLCVFSAFFATNVFFYNFRFLPRFFTGAVVDFCAKTSATYAVSMKMSDFAWKTFFSLFPIWMYRILRGNLRLASKWTMENVRCEIGFDRVICFRFASLCSCCSGCLLFESTALILVNAYSKFIGSIECMFHLRTLRAQLQYWMHCTWPNRFHYKNPFVGVGVCGVCVCAAHIWLKRNLRFLRNLMRIANESEKNNLSEMWVIQKQSRTNANDEHLKVSLRFQSAFQCITRRIDSIRFDLTGRSIFYATTVNSEKMQSDYITRPRSSPLSLSPAIECEM